MAQIPSSSDSRGLSQVQQRDLQFEVPYFDSDVGLELAAGDSWDRKNNFRRSLRFSRELNIKETAFRSGPPCAMEILGPTDTALSLSRWIRRFHGKLTPWQQAEVEGSSC